MKKIPLFLLFGILCVALVLSIVNKLFWQHDKQISVYTETGEIALYNESYALVVGNGSYTNGWDPLDGVPEDVKEVATALEKHSFTVTLKTNLKKADFDAAFEAFIRKGKGKDNRLLFYYGGHGYTEINKQTGEEFGYMVMVDSPPMASDKIDGSRNVSVRSLAEGTTSGLKRSMCCICSIAVCLIAFLTPGIARNRAPFRIALNIPQGSLSLQAALMNRCPSLVDLRQHFWICWKGGLLSRSRMVTLQAKSSVYI